MSVMLGSQHANRFKQNMKVYVLFGEHRERHGVDIGNQVRFNVKDWGSPEGKLPLLKVSMVHQETGYLEVRDARQDVAKLVDLHDCLPFALPMFDPSERDTEGEERRMDDKIKCNPNMSPVAVSK